jgi:hypothetical protein
VGFFKVGFSGNQPLQISGTGGSLILKFVPNIGTAGSLSLGVFEIKQNRRLFYSWLFKWNRTGGYFILGFSDTKNRRFFYS